VRVDGALNGLDSLIENALIGESFVQVVSIIAIPLDATAYLLVCQYIIFIRISHIFTSRYDVEAKPEDEVDYFLSIICQPENTVSSHQWFLGTPNAMNTLINAL